MRQLSRNLKIEELGNGSTLVYTKPDGSKYEILFNETGTYINGTEITDVIVGADAVPVSRTYGAITGTATVNANIHSLDLAVGTDATPVARTAGLISIANSINTNIDALDVGLGADASPVTTRTNNPIAAANAANANIDALDAAIGADNTPVVRTNNPTIANTTLNAKVQALDNTVGADADGLVGSPKAIVTNTTVYAKVNALDRLKTVQTAKVTISWSGGSGTKKLPSSNNADVTNIDLGAVVPARARVLDVFCVTTAASVFSGGATTLVAGLGNATGGTQFGAAAQSIYAINAIAQATVGATFTLVAISNAVSNVWLTDITPGANWNTQTAGEYVVYVTYVDITNV